jgi:hypothetical protein
VFGELEWTADGCLAGEQRLNQLLGQRLVGSAETAAPPPSRSAAVAKHSDRGAKQVVTFTHRTVVVGSAIADREVDTSPGSSAGVFQMVAPPRMW